MRAAALALLLFACTAMPAAAAGAPACPAVGDLALGEIELPSSRAEIVAQKRLVVLAVGGSSTAGIAAGGNAFTLPARLQARLQAVLPGIAVSIVNKGVPGRPTQAIAADMAGAVAATGAKLVIWGAGGADAAAHGDLAGFTDSLQAGIEAAHKAGADILLIDPQYAPSIARIVDVTPYRDAMQGAADAAGVARLRRYDLMRSWSEAGDLDLDASGDGERVAVARRLYDCLADVLATGIAAALH